MKDFKAVADKEVIERTAKALEANGAKRI